MFKPSLSRVAWIAVLLAVRAPPASAAGLAMSLAPIADHPDAKVTVGGSGFGANEAVDIYFDTTDELLVLTDGNGKFSKHSFDVPAGSLPGQHWISAVERDNGKGIQKLFTVTTAWAEQGFSGRGKRYNPYENVLTAGNLDQLDVAWSDDLGGTVFGPPAVVNGVAYVGSCDNNLYALDAATGSVRWKAPAGTCPDFASPAVANGVVYIGSRDSKLYAFNASTGVLKWTFTGNGAYTPIVANGMVYFGGSYIVYAVDAATGAQAWSAATDGPVSSTPVIANGVLYAASLGATLYALDAETGAQLWSTSIGGGNLIETSPAVANNLVFVTASDGKLRAFRARDGVPYWTSPAPNFDITSSPAVANGIVYCGNDNLWQLYAVDAQTGATIWSSETLGEAPAGAPAVANGVVYLGADDGRLYAFSATSGASLWTGLVNKATTAGSPAVSDGMIYIGSSYNQPTDTHLTAFALNAGNSPAYRLRHAPPPSFASLHPDFLLRPQ